MNAPVPTSSALPGDPVAQAWHDGARRAVLAGAAALALGALALAAWLSLAPLAGAVVAGGAVKVDTHRKTVQHRDGGIVREIAVREGDHVAQGQTLLVLEDARVDASLGLAHSQLDAQRARASRLAAEREGASTWRPPEALAARSAAEPRLAEALAREQALFVSRRNALEVQSRLTREQLDEVGREAAAHQREQASVAEALAHMDEEVRVNEALLAENFVNRTRVLSLKRAAAEYRMKRDENAAETSKARQRGAELQLRLAGLRDAYVQDASAELREANAQMVDLEEQLAVSRDAARRQSITAPVAGRVVALRVGTPGAAIGPREPVLDIVPADSPLLVEAKVTVDAIAELQAGQAADVRLTTYQAWNTPLVTGRVVYVSADALTDADTQATYYLVHVQIDREALQRAGDLKLLPGMAAEVFIRGRERTALAWLMEPITHAMRRGLKER